MGWMLLIPAGYGGTATDPDAHRVAHDDPYAQTYSDAIGDSARYSGCHCARHCGCYRNRAHGDADCVNSFAGFNGDTLTYADARWRTRRCSQCGGAR